MHAPSPHRWDVVHAQQQVELVRHPLHRRAVPATSIAIHSRLEHTFDLDSDGREAGGGTGSEAGRQAGKRVCRQARQQAGRGKYGSDAAGSVS